MYVVYINKFKYLKISEIYNFVFDENLNTRKVTVKNYDQLFHVVTRLHEDYSVLQAARKSLIIDLVQLKSN